MGRWDRAKSIISVIAAIFVVVVFAMGYSIHEQKKREGFSEGFSQIGPDPGKVNDEHLPIEWWRGSPERPVSSYPSLMALA